MVGVADGHWFLGRISMQEKLIIRTDVVILMFEKEFHIEVLI